MASTSAPRPEPEAKYDVRNAEGELLGNHGNTGVPSDKSVEASDLAAALHLSLQAQQEPLDAISDAPASPSAHRRPSMKDMMTDLQLRISNEFSPIQDPHGDTLVYVGVPAKGQDQSQQDFAKIEKHFNQMHRMQSSKFLELESEKLNKFFRPNSSIRAEKKFKKLPVFDSIPASTKTGVKYHVDMRPPSEEDDAIILLTELSCNYGIRHWHLAKPKYEIPKSSVMGTDELDTPSNPYYIDHFRCEVEADTEENNSSDINQPAKAKRSAKPEPELPIPTEYSALRHYSGIERLLHAINGDDPKLDSAPKMWTFFALARYFDITRSQKISWWIIDWFNQPNISHFVQNNPEISYQIGLSCNFTNLVRDSFAILVGEKALTDVCNEMRGNLHGVSDVSIHGRRLENLDDDERNRVGHAASSLIRRIRKRFTWLVNDIKWLDQSVEFTKLSMVQNDSGDIKKAVNNSKQVIHDYVQGKLQVIARLNRLNASSDLDHRPATTKDFRHDVAPLDFVRTYNDLPSPVKTFTRSYWMTLAKIKFLTPEINLFHPELDDLADQTFKLDNPVYNGLPMVTKNKLRDAIGAVNLLLQEANPTNLHIFGVAQTSPMQEVRHHEADFDNPENPSEASPSSKRVHFHLGHSGRKSEKRRKTVESDPLSSVKNLPIRQRTENQAPLTDSGPSDIGVSTSSHDSQPGGGDQGTSSSADATSPKDSQGLSPQSKEARLESLPWPESGQAVPHWCNDNTVKTFSNCFICGYTQQFHICKDERMKLRSRCSVCMIEPRHRCSDGVYKIGARCARCARQDASAAPASEYAPSQHRLSLGRVMQQFSDTAPKTSDAWPWNKPGPSPRDTWEPEREPKVAPKYINLHKMFDEISQIVSITCQDIVWPSHIFHANEACPIDLIDTLVCLDDEEWKFLPLWAGGNDDGSGGVYDEAVPNLERGGFRGGKRGIGNLSGHGVDGSVSSDSESYISGFEDISSEAVSTVGKASRFATDGHETVKSISDTSSESEGFLGQKEMWDAVMDMKIDEARKGKAKEIQPPVLGKDESDDFMMENEDGDVSTIMGASSDLPDDCFEDLQEDDQDKELREEAEHIAHEETIDGSSASPLADMVTSTEVDNDMDDIEIIDKHNL